VTDRRKYLPLLIGGGVVVACALGALATELPFAPREVIAAAVAVVAVVAFINDLAAFLFVLLSAATNFYGLVDLGAKGNQALPVYDALLVGLCAIFCLGQLVRGRASIWRRTRSLAARLCLVAVVGVAGIVVYSTVKWDQDFWTSVKASHDFIFFGLAAFGLFAEADEETLRRCRRSLVLVGCLAAAVPILGFAVDLRDVLPGIGNVLTASLFQRTVYRTVPVCFFVVYIGFFAAFFDRSASRGRRTAALLWMALGIVLLGYRAGWLGLVGAVAWMALRDSSDQEHRARRGLLQLALVAAVAYAGVSFMGAGEYIGGRVSSVTEDLSQSGRPTDQLGSLGLRIHQIRGLWAIFSRDPVLGAGFVHPQGPAGNLAFQQGLTYVATNDVGWIDILVRTGIVGSAFFVLATALALRRLRALETSPIGDYARLLRAYFLFSLIFLLGGAPFSCPAGVIPLAALLGVFIAADPACSD